MDGISGFGRGNPFQIWVVDLKHCVLMPQGDIFEFSVGVSLVTARKPSKVPLLDYALGGRGGLLDYALGGCGLDTHEVYVEMHS